ncbi:hypothetical protein AGMMS50230_18650 [Spirochaetia bacterium]|nr:hypothetical protein AGMMS50230_18650 [Spirochaetia bacterium]
MDNSVTKAMDIIFLIFPQKTVAELKEKYGLDMPVKMTFEGTWFSLDFGKGRVFSNPIGRIWHAIQDLAEGDTREEYVASLKALMKQYDLPEEYAGYYADPKTGITTSFKTGKPRKENR